MENLLFVYHARTSFMQWATSESTFGHNSFPRPSLNPTISDDIFRDNCNNVDKSLSIGCNHQLAFFSCTSCISTQVTEKKSKIGAEGLQNKKNVGVASSPFSELNPASIYQVGNSLSHLNKPFENELVEGQMGSDEGSFCLMEQNLLPTSVSRTQEPAFMEALSRNCYGSNLSKKYQGVSIPGYLKQGNDLLSSRISSSLCEKSPYFSQLATSGDDLFDVLGLYEGRSHQLNCFPTLHPVENYISCTEVFSESNTDQLLDAIVSSVCHGAKQSFEESLSWKASMTKDSGSSIPRSSSNNWSASSLQKQRDYISSSVIKSKADSEAATMNCDNIWVESGTNMNNDDLFASHVIRADEISKLNRKRARPGESTRPRPKDRQLIMDRVKELREIVPNGAKCSIDALLEKTIEHMLFLRSVSKHADKLKKTGEPKIVSKDGVVVLKDIFRGGATWAFEVGSQTMTCPIIVEDLNPPREMLVEMLCEERGLFLEIADLIRGLGLTILKGVLEARRDKIWARFAVEECTTVILKEIQRICKQRSTTKEGQLMEDKKTHLSRCNLPNRGWRLTRSRPSKPRTMTNQAKKSHRFISCHNLT